MTYAVAWVSPTLSIKKLRRSCCIVLPATFLVLCLKQTSTISFQSCPFTVYTASDLINPLSCSWFPEGNSTSKWLAGFSLQGENKECHQWQPNQPAAEPGINSPQKACVCLLLMGNGDDNLLIQNHNEICIFVMCHYKMQILPTQWGRTKKEPRHQS